MMFMQRLDPKKQLLGLNARAYAQVFSDVHGLNVQQHVAINFELAHFSQRTAVEALVLGPRLHLVYGPVAHVIR